MAGLDLRLAENRISPSAIAGFFLGTLILLAEDHPVVRYLSRRIPLSRKKAESISCPAVALAEEEIPQGITVHSSSIFN